MVSGIIVFIGSVFLLYFICILLLSYGWIKGKKAPVYRLPVNPGTFISIVVAVRNEESQISSLLRHLSAQDYPDNLYEIVMVNDHSTDNTARLIREWSEEKRSNIKLFSNSMDEEGKKSAIANGISKTEGELVVITDADCVMGKYWLKSMAAIYEKDQPYMISGPVLLNNRKKNAIEYFQELEFITLLGTSAGASFLNRPLFCNAANMAFDRKIFNHLEDPFFSGAASGDDTMLLLKIKKEFPEKIQFNMDKNALVETLPEKTLKGFWNQRKRWISKSKYYKDFDILATSFVIFLENFSLVTLFAAIFFNHLFLKYLALFFVLKIFTDLLLILPTASYFKKYYILAAYLPSQLVYPFYATAIAISGKLTGFKWKKRYYP
jgi:cellulose synthase/poly-beta-1,6-N-acetylglucosamine synthase-like glycosyltransferase